MHQPPLSALQLQRPTSSEPLTTHSERLRPQPPVDSERRNRAFSEVEEDSVSQQHPLRIYSVPLQLHLLEECSEEEEEVSEQRQLQRSVRRRQEVYSVKLLNRRRRRSASVHRPPRPLPLQEVSSVNSLSKTRSVLLLPPLVDYSVNPLNQLQVVSLSVRRVPIALPLLF